MDHVGGLCLGGQKYPSCRLSMCTVDLNHSWFIIQDWWIEIRPWGTMGMVELWLPMLIYYHSVDLDNMSHTWHYYDLYITWRYLLFYYAYLYLGDTCLLYIYEILWIRCIDFIVLFVFLEILISLNFGVGIAHGMHCIQNDFMAFIKYYLYTCNEDIYIYIYKWYNL